jgi:hypothetical protein
MSSCVITEFVELSETRAAIKYSAYVPCIAHETVSGLAAARFISCKYPLNLVILNISH